MSVMSVNNFELNVLNSKILLQKGDITKEATDAIVNAANNYLTPGGGVSGAIHRAAGPELAKECAKLGGCKTGEAKITLGYNLPAKYVIHTVGPVYSGKPSDKAYLEQCYKNSLLLADKKGLESISFPSISTGIFGYPVKEAAKIAINAIYDFLKTINSSQQSSLKIVKMILFSDSDFEEYKHAALQLKNKI